jgi:hypothetical protein
MWILNFLPNWIFSAILFIGIAGFSVTYLIRFIPIPAIYIYKTPIQLISLALIVIGVYMSGAISNDEAWKLKVSELEKKVAEAQVESAKENTKIVEKVVVKKEYYKERGNDIIKYVDREVVKYDESCKIPKEFVESINKAAAAK